MVVGLPADIFTVHAGAVPGAVAECRALENTLCRLLVGDAVDGELAVDDVVVLVGDEDRSDWEESFSTSSRNRAASSSVPSMLVAIAARVAS